MPPDRTFDPVHGGSPIYGAEEASKMQTDCWNLVMLGHTADVMQDKAVPVVRHVHYLK